MRATHTRPALLAFAAAAALCAASGPTLAQTLETDHITAQDKTFITQAAHGGLMEVREARTEQNSRNRYVDLYAHRIMKDHLLNYSQLGALAREYNVSIPGTNSVMVQVDSPDETGTPPPHALSAHPRIGPTMPDRTYMRSEVTDHQKTIAVFQNEAKNGGTAALRNFAAQSLPVLENHLKMAQQFVRTGRITPLPNPTIPTTGTPG